MCIVITRNYAQTVCIVACRVCMVAHSLNFNYAHHFIGVNLVIVHSCIVFNIKDVGKYK